MNYRVDQKFYFLKDSNKNKILLIRQIKSGIHDEVVQRVFTGSEKDACISFIKNLLVMIANLGQDYRELLHPSLLFLGVPLVTSIHLEDLNL